MTALDPAPRADQAARPAGGSVLDPSDTFVGRHVGPDAAEVASMLETIGLAGLDELVERAVPATIRTERPLSVGEGLGEHAALQEIRGLADMNRVLRSVIGMGYHDTITPPVILRNILENPGWYTQYTPYQAEIAQGRLEALLNFQTMVADLTGLPLANASLLDEATAAAEAMVMCRNITRAKDRTVFLVADDCHPQTIEVVAARAEAIGVECRVASPADMQAGDDVFGALLQSPNTHGEIRDDEPLVRALKEAGATVVVATDLLALTLMRPPGEYGADIAVGSAQRFGVPMGMGGPHAAFVSTLEEHARKTPGRLVGVSRDADGNRALRLAIQTREQHIRRDRATSNICTAQVLLAIIAGMYAAYHGPDGLQRIARRVHAMAAALAAGLRHLGYDVAGSARFDTLRIPVAENAKDSIIGSALELGFNLREYPGEAALGVALDETTTRADVVALLTAFNEGRPVELDVDALLESAGDLELPEPLARRSGYLTHEVFNAHRSETEMLRYLARLQGRDLSLAQSMIPLGSCTMKLNATAEMIPVTLPGFGRIHPFAPADQTRGYGRLFADLETWLADITGFHAVSLQPNAGSQGEYAGLLVIRAYHRDHGDEDRRVCLIPVSAHGTNPASAVAAGFEVVPVQCDERGDIDLDDLRRQAEKHEGRVGAMMITYPSTHGVFEPRIREACGIVHEHGGLVYLDGANMNAMVGVARPGEIGADVCHLNLHKTFCIPHGGGGPGMGPIGVVERLAPYLPTHGVRPPASAGDRAIPAISAAPYGSPSILPISWMYIRMMGSAGLRRATEVAILNANYMARRLAGHYDVLFTGESGLVAHEFIIDCRPFDKSAGIKIDDIAKRLIDYGFHAPTMSWPVAGTLMIEPTESESKAELDRFCDAMIAIREEIREIEEGRADRQDNVLKHAPHTIETVSADAWDRPYPRSRAAWPLPWLHGHKFWPPVARVDNPYGDRNLVCSCEPMESYAGG